MESVIVNGRKINNKLADFLPKLNLNIKNTGKHYIFTFLKL